MQNIKTPGGLAVIIFVNSLCVFLCKVTWELLRPAPLVDAASRADWKTVRYLVTVGHDVNEVDERDHTALMYTCGYGNVEIAKILLAKGAKINAIDNIGCSVKCWARSGKQKFPDIENMIDRRQGAVPDGQ